MDQGTRSLINLLDHAGIPFSLHKVIPFIGELVPDIDIKGPTIVIGSYSMRHVAKRKNLTPGSFDLGDLTYADHIAAWGDHMLNEDAIFCTFAEALDHLKNDAPSFIRPTVDSKFFAGALFDREEFTKWWNGVVVLEEDDGSSLRASTKVMIASPKTIQAEYRCWALFGTIVTASLYKRGGRVIYSDMVDQEIIDFAQARVDEWQPKEAFVIDIAKCEDGLKIVETNTMNAAGFYASDVSKIVAALENRYSSDLV